MDEIFRRYLGALSKTEWMPPEHLGNYQRGLVRQLVQHAHSQIPFYTERLGCLLTADGEIDLRLWDQVPVLTRDDATTYSKEMRANDLPATLGNITEHKTSGSNGASLSFAANSLAKFAYNGALTRLALWHGADPSQQLAQIRIYRQGIVPQYPEGETTKAWSWAAPDTDVFGLDMRTPVDNQIEWLLRHKTPYLMTLPSNAMALAYAASPEVARALDFEIIFSISETVLPGARELIASKLGAKLVGIYSCEEIGYVATECPVGPHYHICSEMTLVEIVDDAGQPVAPGQPGRVLVTGLYNYATPFIRYDIGDVAIADPEPCICGRSLPVLSQVLGRTRHAFVFRDGKRVWPRVWYATAIQAFVTCREFQVVQVDFERIEVRYVADDRGSRIDIDGLRRYAREHLHPSVDIAAVLVDTIARGPGGKFDPFISEVVAP
jgi:phenylacetate-CoA ligase